MLARIILLVILSTTLTSVRAALNINDNMEPSYTLDTSINLDYKVHQQSMVFFDDTNNRLYFGDPYLVRITAYDMTDNGNFADTIPDLVLGANNFSENNSSSGATAGSLGSIAALAYNNNTNQFFSARSSMMMDSYSRVMVFNNGNSLINGQQAFAAIGKDNLTTSACSSDQNCLKSPTSLAIDHERGYLIVGDGHRGNSVRIFDINSINPPETAINILGKNSYSNYLTPTSTNINSFIAACLAYDETDNYLYVCDENSHRVLVFDLTTITDGEDAIAVIGSNDFTTFGTLGQITSIAIDHDEDTIFVANNLGELKTFSIAAVKAWASAYASATTTTAVPIVNTVVETGDLDPYIYKMTYDQTNKKLFTTTVNATGKVYVFDFSSDEDDSDSNSGDSTPIVPGVANVAANHAIASDIDTSRIIQLVNLFNLNDDDDFSDLEAVAMRTLATSIYYSNGALTDETSLFDLNDDDEFAEDEFNKLVTFTGYFMRTSLFNSIYSELDADADNLLNDEEILPGIIADFRERLKAYVAEAEDQGYDLSDKTEYRHIILLNQGNITQIAKALDAMKFAKAATSKTVKANLKKAKTKMKKEIKKSQVGRILKYDITEDGVTNEDDLSWLTTISNLALRPVAQLIVDRKGTYKNSFKSNYAKEFLESGVADLYVDD